MFNGNLLVGLRNGSVAEFKNVLSGDSPQENILVKSHFEGEIWGLDIVPDQNKVITCADDNQIMLFDYAAKKFERKGTVSGHKYEKKAGTKPKTATASSMSQYPPNQQARALCYSKAHNHVVVCSNFGKVSVRDFDDLDKKIATLKDAEEWCEVARFSPCEKFLATASHDNALYVYSVSEDGSYSLYKSFSKHSSYITALDWSQDSTYIRTQCGAYEKLYFNIAEKQPDAAGMSNTKDLTWATTTLKLGWDVQGINPASEDGTHINGVTVSDDHQLLVSTDDWGLTNIYNYPVMDVTHQPRSYAGHSEHVVRARFTPDGQKLFTIGGQDKALIQW